MNDILDIEIILKRQKYPFIYNAGIILIIIILIFTYVSFTYKYKTYYINNGTVKNNQLEILINIQDLKYIKNNNMIKINDKLYKYNIVSIEEKIYTDKNFNNYKYIYLKIDNLNEIDNYVYEVKILKENKRIIEHLLDYL